jgi:TetR/AcrR family transcriptional regulator, transcriptional repressor for nem operon
MNRPRTFDLQELRERVTDVFATHGYHATSMSMLSDACGLGKQSLYNALGDKEAAYLQSIDCAAARNAAMSSAMAQAASGRDAIAQFFAAAMGAGTVDAVGQRTCIVTAGLLEGVQADAIAAKLREQWLSLCELMQRTVERGQRDGSVRTDVASQDLCAVLVTLLAGTRVTLRTPTERQTLQQTVQWVLKLLDCGSPAP